MNETVLITKQKKKNNQRTKSAEIKIDSRFGTNEH